MAAVAVTSDALWSAASDLAQEIVGKRDEAQPPRRGAAAVPSQTKRKYPKSLVGEEIQKTGGARRPATSCGPHCASSTRRPRSGSVRADAQGRR